MDQTPMTKTMLTQLTEVLNRNVAQAEERLNNARAAHSRRQSSESFVWDSRGMTVEELLWDCELGVERAKAIRDWTLRHSFTE